MREPIARLVAVLMFAFVAWGVLGLYLILSGGSPIMIWGEGFNTAGVQHAWTAVLQLSDLQKLGVAIGAVRLVLTILGAMALFSLNGSAGFFFAAALLVDVFGTLIIATFSPSAFSTVVNVAVIIGWIILLAVGLLSFYLISSDNG